MERKAIYAGSFDPPTNGHVWMIEQGSKLFDELVVAIGTNPDKRYTFSLEERENMLKRIIKRLNNISVSSSDKQYTVVHATSLNADYTLRGLRSQGDFEYEKTMRYVNGDMNPRITSVFLMPPRNLSEISSSFVKGLVGYNGWEEVVGNYTPREAHKKLLQKFSGKLKDWLSLWERIGASGSPVEVYKELVQRYCEATRWYHDFIHISDALSEFEPVSGMAKDPDAVRMAIWFHDIIYDTHKKDNEKQSAEFAKQALEYKVSNEFAEKVKKFIIATEHEFPPESMDEAILLDVDLSILGASEEKFAETSEGIREEYAWVDDEEYLDNRIHVLQGFLSRPHIFQTDFFRQKYEIKARENLQRSIRGLSQ